MGSEIATLNGIFPLLWRINDMLQKRPDGTIVFAGSTNDVDDYREVLHLHDPLFERGKCVDAGAEDVAGRRLTVPFFYLSFCDPEKPEGQQFVGATIVEAENERAALARSWMLKINPGGEGMFIELNFVSADDIPPEARHYLDRLVPREAVLAEGGRHLEADAGSFVHDGCNRPVDSGG